MRELPIGVQNFAMLRRDNLLYVDKTGHLLTLIQSGRRYFLSRPRRFGKSLTLSTLEAMFAGKARLFCGLAAEEWVKKQSERPYPVVRLDMSSLRMYSTAEELNDSLAKGLEDFAFLHNIDIPPERTGSGALLRLILTLYKKFGPVVILIDEYDKPILDHLNNLAKAEEMRKVLRSFYGVLKSCDEYIRFIFITGISKFSKMGVFSVMNNLFDISLNEDYADIVGYTQRELEQNFNERIDFTATKIGISYQEILAGIKEYYDGFSFDGKTRLYNPFSILNFFATGEFGNYWYESGSSNFIVNWMKGHDIQAPEEYRHIKVKSNFTSSQEIERATPTSFLFQSGYLTIEKKEGQILTLDYPNREVLDSLSGLYLELIYNVKQYASLGTDVWRALEKGSIDELVQLYNIALAEIPYEDFPKRDEFWYRSLFLMLLRGAGVIVFAEVHTNRGRSDAVIRLSDKVIVLEFKLAERTAAVEQAMNEGRKQLIERDYAQGYAGDERQVFMAVIVADDEKCRAAASTVA